MLGSDWRAELEQPKRGSLGRATGCGCGGAPRAWSSGQRGPHRHVTHSRERDPTLPVSVRTTAASRAVLGLRPPERYAEVEQRLIEQDADEQGDQQQPDAAVRPGRVASRTARARARRAPAAVGRSRHATTAPRRPGRPPAAASGRCPAGGRRPVLRSADLARLLVAPRTPLVRIRWVSRSSRMLSGSPFGSVSWTRAYVSAST